MVKAYTGTTEEEQDMITLQTVDQSNGMKCGINNSGKGRRSETGMNS